jgi:hypothetical protein
MRVGAVILTPRVYRVNGIQLNSITEIDVTDLERLQRNKAASPTPERVGDEELHGGCNWTRTGTTSFLRD